MGCSQSISEEDPNLFKAKNVDETDKAKNTVILEVKGQKLIVLSKQKKMMASWPVACLHRYGHSTDILMIETGHGCDTGQGLFLFRCHRANQLFEKLRSVWGDIQDQHSRAMSLAYPPQMSIMTGQTVLSSGAYYNTTSTGSNGLPLTGMTSLSGINHPSTSTSHYTPPTPGTRGSASSHNTGVSGPMLNTSERSLPQRFELQPAPVSRQEMLNRRRINSTTVSYNRQNDLITLNHHTRHHTVAADNEYVNSEIIREHRRHPVAPDTVTFNADSELVSFRRESPEMPPRGISANSLRSENEHAPPTPGSNSTSGIGSLNGNSTTSEGRCNGGPSLISGTTACQQQSVLSVDPWKLQNGRKLNKQRKARPRMLRHPNEFMSLSPTLPMSARDYVNTANASLDVGGTPLPATAVGNGSHFNFDFDLSRLLLSNGTALHPNGINRDINYAPIEVSTKNGDFYSCGASSASSGLGPGTPLTPRTPGGCNHVTDYAEIDHHKTRALSNAFRSRQRERKSRHASTETAGMMSGGV